MINNVISEMAFSSNHTTSVGSESQNPYCFKADQSFIKDVIGPRAIKLEKYPKITTHTYNTFTLALLKTESFLNTHSYLKKLLTHP